MQTSAVQTRQIVRNRPMDFIRAMVEKGGPTGEEIQQLQEALNNLESEEALVELEIVLKSRLTTDTMLGHTYLKPYGYAGDFEIIEKIYAQKRHADRVIDAWDQFYHAMDACQAVRNRKTYFKNIMQEANANGSKSVLILGSGPCTDLFEYLSENPDNRLHFTCVDVDATAIAYARDKNVAFGQHISFVHRNIFRFQSTECFDLIWSAGLFDYLNDDQFVFISRRMKALLANKGKLIIGNFSEENPSRYCMELVGDWFLIHRSPELLIQLGVRSGFDKEAIHVGQEELGINLFVHYQG
ncbi:MAG: class I SAM-dependent methyltransferase [Chitinophagaceae bacterium]|nr:MAG: class I SAM-dependent methyltransferase [Chitinophagaceae bacterium]